MTTDTFDANAYEHRDRERQERAGRCIQDALFFRNYAYAVQQHALHCEALGHIEHALALVERAEFLRRRCEKAINDANRIVEGG